MCRVCWEGLQHVLFFCFKSNSKEGGQKKTSKQKTNIKYIFGKVPASDQIKHNIGQISRKDNQGDEIRTTINLFKKVNEGYETIDNRQCFIHRICYLTDMYK